MNQNEHSSIDTLKSPPLGGDFFLPYRVQVNSYLRAKIEKYGEDSPIGRQFLFNEVERDQETGLVDPIGDQVHLKDGGIIHRYKNRVIYISTQACSSICRFCFRKNELEDKRTFTSDIDKAIAYIIKHPEIEEFIFSGGDPFILPIKTLRGSLEKLAGKVKYIRFHTRVPAIDPKRVTRELTELLEEQSENFDRINVVIHTNHIQELGDQFKFACKELIKSGVDLLSQTVLLREVNDNSASLKELFQELINCRVRPYYLHHPDRVKGGMHFYLSIDEGRKIYAALRQELPGWAIPHYILDDPSGSGKIALGSETNI